MKLVRFICAWLLMVGMYVGAAEEYVRPVSPQAGEDQPGLLAVFPVGVDKSESDSSSDDEVSYATVKSVEADWEQGYIEVDQELTVLQENPNEQDYRIWDKRLPRMYRELDKHKEKYHLSNASYRKILGQLDGLTKKVNAIGVQLEPSAVSVPSLPVSASDAHAFGSLGCGLLSLDGSNPPSPASQAHSASSFPTVLRPQASIPEYLDIWEQSYEENERVINEFEQNPTQEGLYECQGFINRMKELWEHINEVATTELDADKCNRVVGLRNQFFGLQKRFNVAKDRLASVSSQPSSPRELLTDERRNELYHKMERLAKWTVGGVVTAIVAAAAIYYFWLKKPAVVAAR